MQMDPICHKNISESIQKLQLAKKFLSPIIDQIIAKATSVTHSDFKIMLQKYSPICAISKTQCSHVCFASEIIHAVASQLQVFDDYPDVMLIANAIQQYLVSELPIKLSNPEKIYIDAGRIKQLKELHELINDTIIKLMKVTLDANENNETKENLENNDTKENLKTKLVLIDIDSNEVCNNKEQNKSPIEVDLNVSCYNDDDFDKLLNYPGQKHNYDQVESKFINNEEKLEKLMKLYGKLSVAIRDLSNKSSTNSCTTQKEFPCQVIQSKFENEISQDNISLSTQLSDLRFLKDLDQFKDMLCAMDYPYLTIYKVNEETCEFLNYPHIHVLMNGIPVVIKMNQDSIDVLHADTGLVYRSVSLIETN